MRVVVFCGPTLPRLEIDRLPKFEFRPPAMRGDVLTAALDKPAVIALVDGYFDRVPSVWHKEILWAMSQGIHVFGASSMGALRAAELEAFGMQGVGNIFESYRDGALQDDDEVTISHANEAAGYRRLSEAMVNIRPTLDAARVAGIITESERCSLVAVAKALPYWDRSYPMILRAAAASVAEASLRSLTAWLEQGRIDQKALDARLLLRTLSERMSEFADPLKVNFRFAHSDAWQALYQEVALRPKVSQEAVPDDILEGWLDELLVRGTHGAAHDAALARALANGGSQRVAAVNASAVASIADDFRRERSLCEPEQFAEWLTEQGLEDEDLAHFFRGEAALRRIRAVLAPKLGKYLIDQLRADGRFAEVTQRASLKREELQRRGLDAASLEDMQLTESDLWCWYFGKCRRMSLPAVLTAYAESERVDTERLRRAILREYCYMKTATD